MKLANRFFLLSLLIIAFMHYADAETSSNSNKRIYIKGNAPSTSNSSNSNSKTFNKKAKVRQNKQVLKNNKKNSNKRIASKNRNTTRNRNTASTKTLNDVENKRSLNNDYLSNLSKLNSSDLKPSKTIKSRAKLSHDVNSVRDFESKKVSYAGVTYPAYKSNNYNNFRSYNLDHVGPFSKTEGSKYYELSSSGDRLYLTLDRGLQEHASGLLKKYKVPRGAIVAVDPSSGKILALSGHSRISPSSGQDLVAQSTFPAASLFKIITAAAAVETSGVTADTNVRYRGGIYTLNKSNYLPNPKTDKVQMKLATAMGKSCNPAFARVALNNLSVEVLTQYAENFGFSRNLSSDFPLSPSSIQVSNDRYHLARTAAGFGSAYISPVHAAMIAAAIGNKGLMMRPYIVDSIVDSAGKLKKHQGMNVLDQIVLESTADELLRMMESTTKEGTGVKQFRKASPMLKNMKIASKTGTLSGTNPKGRYYWFIAVAPSDNPKIALASMVIDDGSANINGVGLGRLFLEYFFSSSSLHAGSDETLINSNILSSNS